MPNGTLARALSGETGSFIGPVSHVERPGRTAQFEGLVLGGGNEHRGDGSPEVLHFLVQALLVPGGLPREVQPEQGPVSIRAMRSASILLAKTPSQSRLSIMWRAIDSHMWKDAGRPSP